MPHSSRVRLAALSCVLALSPALAGAQALTIQYVTVNPDQTLTITGTNYCAAPAVTLGGAALAVQSVSPTQVVAQVPAVAQGTYYLMVSCGTLAGRTVYFTVSLGAGGAGAPGPPGPPGPLNPNVITDSASPFRTAVGSGALFNNTTGFGNTATGYQSLFLNATGNNNTATGHASLANNTGSNNTASGFRALLRNATGGSNTATGASSLFANTTGSNNTATGSDSLLSNTTGGGNTASGFGSLVRNTTGSNNTATGFGSLPLNTTGGNNTASGNNALQSNTTGFNNTAVGAFANVSAGNLTNATAIGAFAVVNASNKIRLGNAAVTVIQGQVAYTFSSDKYAKENFRPMDAEEVLSKIAGLPVSSWNYIGHDPEQFRHYGPMAQDFFAAFGHDDVGQIGTDTTITSGDVDGVLLAAAKGLQERTADLQERTAGLQERTAELRQENESLKAALQQMRTENEASLQHMREELDALKRMIGAASEGLR